MLHWDCLVYSMTIFYQLLMMLMNNLLICQAKFCVQRRYFDQLGWHLFYFWKRKKKRITIKINENLWWKNYELNVNENLPLFWPAWRPTMVSPAFNCSSVNSLVFKSAGFGPNFGPVQLASFHTARPSAKNVFVTWAMSFFSKRSTVWKTSISGTPYSLNAFWKFCTFSINLNVAPVSLILATDPGLILLINLQQTTPSLRTSSYDWPAGNFHPRMASIHSWASLSWHGSRLLAI